MAHSTTTTASHILTKYSKCYISGGSIQSSQADGGGEWQHFVNPVLELVLDIKKSRLNNELESVRLRILWNMDTSGIKNEVLFEDLDLLAYSDIPASGQPMPSLPLKAVYRDAVVGIRYLYPIISTPDAQPAFRRFQITFASAHSALEFIKSIRNVCPCKVNPLPSSGNAVTAIRARPTQVARQSFAGSAPSRGVGSRMQASSRPFSTSQGTTVQPPPSRNNSSDEMGNRDGPAGPACIGWANEISSSLGEPRAMATTSMQANSSLDDLPGSTPPSSSVGDTSMPPPRLPWQTPAPDASSLLSGVRDSTKLDNLSSSELEDLVSRVVCEEGFSKLLQRVDSMWRIKGLLQ
ncbi:hypothetical protein BDN71DRAFT_1383406 [Pleurotus eryngii]|uniref:Uncharacterized protein n=1 Tax=Pleurotus eryngii TaxID=5323 RepID=A0A9P6DJ41_PLEER|nr:hypothetical protein BDN71DRAFT_1383406 [Pleurotus eryngii]